MNPRLILDVTTLDATDDTLELRGTFRDPGFQHAYYIRWPGTAAPGPAAIGNALLCLGLHSAIAQGLDLEIRAPVSRQLLHQARIAQEMLVFWVAERGFRPVDIITDGVDDEARAADGVLMAYTGGVDSLHALRLNAARVTHLLYVHGYDVKLGDVPRRALLAGAVRETAALTGKRAVEVVTNVRHYMDRHTNWVTETHGIALAAIAHLLTGEAGTFLISSTNTYSRRHLLGSDPQLDPLWSAGGLTVEHFGSATDRTGKLAAIADWPVARATLRSCTAKEALEPNCGRCEKCARTQAALIALGTYAPFAHRFAAHDIEDLLRGLDLTPSRNPGSDWLSVRRALDRPDLDPAQERLRVLLDEKLRARAHTGLGAALAPDIRHSVGTPAWNTFVGAHPADLARALAEADPAWFRERAGKNLPALRDGLLARLARDPARLRARLRKARWGF